MKIAIIPAWYPSETNKVAGIFVDDQVRALKKAGHDVKVIYSEPIVKNYKKTSTNDAGTIYTSYPVFINKTLSFPVYFISIFFAFIRLLNQGFKPELIHAHVSLPAGFASVIIKKLFKIPVVVTEHTSPFSYLMRNNISRVLTKYTLKQCNRILTVSTHSKQDMQRYGINSYIEVIHNMVDTSEFEPKQVKNTRRELLFVGGLDTNQKGLGNLLQALHLAKEELSPFNLVVVGDGKLLDKYKKIVKDLSLDKHVYFAGRLKREDVVEKMKNCDLFILPSLHETFGVVIIEAMACGKPVLSTKCGGPEDILLFDYLGELANPGDINDLAEKLLIMDERLNCYSVKQISDYVKSKFDSIVIVKKLEEVYRDVLKG